MNLNICTTDELTADEVIEGVNGHIPRMGEAIDLERDEEINDLIVFNVIYTLEGKRLIPNVWCKPANSESIIETRANVDS